MTTRIVSIPCALLFCVSVALTGQPAPATGKQPEGKRAKHTTISFDPLPPGWIAEQNVMDDIWTPLRLRGMNFYAYGGPAAPHTYAARSDPDSPLYQAWVGAYLIEGNESANAHLAMTLADLDQRSWLSAMGDPDPAFTLTAQQVQGTILIDGVGHPLVRFEATTHSDLGPGITPLGKHVGMPHAASWKDKLAPFHDVTLRGYYTYWYDRQRDLTIIIYACAAAFTFESGERRDNFPALDAHLLQMMRSVHLIDAGGTHG